jgi:hypothetical protein
MVEKNYHKLKFNLHRFFGVNCVIDTFVSSTSCYCIYNTLNLSPRLEVYGVHGLCFEAFPKTIQISYTKIGRYIDVIYVF